jgi:hypothetical protein
MSFATNPFAHRVGNYLRPVSLSAFARKVRKGKKSRNRAR